MTYEKQIIEIIEGYCGNNNKDVTQESHLFDDLCFDSLSHILCIIEVEEKLDVNFMDSDIDEIKTAQDLINTYIARVDENDK